MTAVNSRGVINPLTGTVFEEIKEGDAELLAVMLAHNEAQLLALNSINTNLSSVCRKLETLIRHNEVITGEEDL